MLSMLSVLWPRRILPTASQSLDLLRETLIGLCTILTLRDGSSAGHSQQLVLWSHSGSISLTSTTLSPLRDLTTKIIYDLKTPKPVRCGRDASGLSPIKSTDITSPPSKDKSNFTFITLMTQSLTLRHHTTTRTHTPLTDTTRDGDK